jgi:hypothetical protein
MMIPSRPMRMFYAEPLGSRVIETEMLLVQSSFVHNIPILNESPFLLLDLGRCCCCLGGSRSLLDRSSLFRRLLLLGGGGGRRVLLDRRRLGRFGGLLGFGLRRSVCFLDRLDLLFRNHLGSGGSLGRLLGDFGFLAFVLRNHGELLHLVGRPGLGRELIGMLDHREHASVDSLDQCGSHQMLLHDGLQQVSEYVLRV